MQRINGFVERGNTTVLVGGLSSSNIVQGSFPSATLTVFLTGTQTLATIYGDNGVTLKANPFTAASDGSFFFYAANGRYDIQFSGTGLVGQTFSFGDMLVLDSAQFSSNGTTVTFSSTPAFSCALFSFFEITLTGNVTGPTFSGQALWQVIHISIIQDAVGGRTWVWPGTFVHPPTIAAGANAITECSFFWDGTNWRNFAATGDSLAVPGAASITGSLTIGGSLSVSNITTGQFLGGPTSGAPASSTFRSLVNSDIPWPWFDVRNYGAKVDNSTDDTIAVQAALTAANAAGGGIVVIPQGVCVIAGTLSLANFIGVTIRGVTGGFPGLPGGRVTLKFTGSVGPLISLSNSQGLAIQDMFIQSSNAAMSGNIIECGPNQAAFVSFSRLNVSGTSNGPAVGISLDQAIDVVIDRCDFLGLKVGIRGAKDNTSFANNVSVVNCSFGQAGVALISNAMIQNATQGWSISNCDFELGTGTGPNVLGYTAGASGQGVSFFGNWIGDASGTNSNTLFVVPASAGGFSFSGNQISSNSASVIAFSIGNNATGIVISGNGSTASSTIGTQYALGTGCIVQIGPNNYGIITNFMTGTPAAGSIIIDNNSLVLSPSTLNVKRLKTSQGATAYSGADAAIVPNAVNGAGGWGVGAVVASSSGTDQAFSFTITAAGTPGANPTCVVTFKDGTWTVAPHVLVVRNDINAPVASGPPLTWVNTPTTITITFIGTPVAGTSYNFNITSIGT